MGVTARIWGLRLRTIRYKNGKHSLNLYWYQRAKTDQKDTESYLGKEEGLTFAPCVVCGCNYIKNRLNHIYCSNACKCRAYQKRRKECAAIKQNY